MKFKIGSDVCVFAFAVSTTTTSVLTRCGCPKKENIQNSGGNSKKIKLESGMLAVSVFGTILPVFIFIYYMNLFIRH